VPTVLRVGPYRFFFYANEGMEPPHIHVQRESSLAKFWLAPVALAGSTGFPAHELTRVLSIVENHKEQLKEAWHGYFGG
jgi:hypothetical protein